MDFWVLFLFYFEEAIKLQKKFNFTFFFLFFNLLNLILIVLISIFFIFNKL